MAEVRKRQNNPAPGIDYSELHIPDDSHLGTGKFTLSLQPNALISKKVITGIIINKPIFQMSVNINPDPKEVPVLLGKADGSNPISQKLFSLPQNIGLAGTHRFEATFEGWEIKALEMNGVKLLEKGASKMADTKLNVKEGSINFWIEKQKLEFADNKATRLFQADSPEGSVFIVKDDDNMLKFFHVYIGKGRTDVEYDVSGLNPSERHMITLTWSVKKKEIIMYVDNEKAASATIAYD